MSSHGDSGSSSVVGLMYKLTMLLGMFGTDVDAGTPLRKVYP